MLQTQAEVREAEPVHTPTINRHFMSIGIIVDGIGDTLYHDTNLIYRT